LDAKSTYSFALSPDGRWAAAATGASQVRLWDLESKKPSHELLSGLIPAASPFGGEQMFSANGKSVLLVTLSTLRLFDTATGKERVSLGHRSRTIPRFSGDGRTLFTMCDEFRRSWDVSSVKKPRLLEHKPRRTWEGICGNQPLGRSEDDRFVLDWTDRGIRVLDMASGRVLRQLENDRRWSACFGIFSPDGNRVLVEEYFINSGEPEVLRLYDARTGAKTGEIKLANRVILGRPCLFSPDGRFIAWADRSHAVHVHDGITGKRVRTLVSARKLPLQECGNAGLLFSPDAEHLIIVSDYHELFKSPDPDKGSATLPTRVFHVASGREVSRFYNNPKTTNKALQHSCLACSPNGRLLAAAEQESGTIRLLEIASGKVRAEFAAHRHGVHALAFSPDGRVLASGGEDAVTFLWDVIGPSSDAKDLTAAWADLASDDARRAGVAIASFLQKPAEAAAFLKNRLCPAEAMAPRLVAQLLADLGGENYRKREAAMQALVNLGDQGDATARRALDNNPTLESQRRLERVLQLIESKSLSAQALQALRGIEVLEHLATPEARPLLQAIAKGAPDAQLTRQANAALRRLGPRRP